MSAATRVLRPFVSVGLPVAVSAVLITLAVVNIVLVKGWQHELEDGVLWGDDGRVVALEVAPGGAGDRAGIAVGDALLRIDDREIASWLEAIDTLHQATPGRPLTYVVVRAGAAEPVEVIVVPVMRQPSSLYYSLALVGILSILVGASVRLRRPNDVSTLHFFWLTVAFFGVLAFTPSGRYDRLDYFFDWADMVARLLLPPLFLHFSLGFPERPDPWAKSDAGRKLLPLVYLPALLLGAMRVTAFTNGVRGADTTPLLEGIEWWSLVYLAVCLAGGLVIMMRALTRLRSVTANRQLRWIVWGSATGALPFLLLYVIPFLVGRVPPFAEYSAVLLGCIPLAFASALVRYRLMDVEVIIKKGLVGAAYLLLLAVIYGVTLQFLGFAIGTGAESSRFWALMATFVVVLLAPWIREAIQAGLDRLYYRDRYDYRRALLSFARDLNSDLDLERLSTRLVERVRETLVVDRMALLLADPHGDAGRFVVVAAEHVERAADIHAGSVLSARLSSGSTVIADDSAAGRRLPADEAATWREVGLYCFVPCVSKGTTIAVLAAGRRPQQEPLSSEDLALLASVAGQAATALENARLYGQLQGKADEIERLRQFSDSVVESLTDGLVVVDLEDRVLRWNRRMETLAGIARGRAVGRHLGGLFPRTIVELLEAARHDQPAGASLYRVPFGAPIADPKRPQLVNVTIAPFQTAEGAQAGWIMLIVDVTDRVTLEEQLQLSEKMAAVGLLAAGVAHEVNTPLTGISSFTQLLLERADPADPRTGLLQKIERQTFRAAKIVTSLLNLARPSGGDTGPVDLNAVIGDVLALLEHQLRSAHVQVRKNLAASPVVVNGVEHKLQQVFLNLLLNARDAMPTGGWLSIDTRVVDADAIVEVSDTGVGIPPDQVARIYDPFFTTKGGGGTGLGLSVTYGIVQEHGGTLVCESEPGQGTTFRLTLTRAEDRGQRAEGGSHYA
ncbi:MAG TPA: ATP-binding protein [Vicinamibacterales bacterium]|nr:ATP-binding protein [Vicinamibacterales bacterium]